MPAKVLIKGNVSRRWEVKHIVKTSGTLRTVKPVWQGRVYPDPYYAALNIVSLNTTSSVRPSYLKGSTVCAILPISLLRLNLEVLSHNCGSVQWAAVVRSWPPALTKETRRKVHPVLRCQNTGKTDGFRSTTFFLTGQTRCDLYQPAANC